MENLGDLPGVTEPVGLGFGRRLVAAHSGSSHYGTPPLLCLAKPEGLGSSPSPLPLLCLQSRQATAEL